MVENPNYLSQKKAILSGLTNDMIDLPIIGLVNGLNSLPYCFTLQCCYGHFLCDGQSDPHNLEPLPVNGTRNDVEYRIAYVAFCVEKSDAGKALLATMKRIPAIDPGYVQFGCAEWFWNSQVNSYALQVAPDRFKHQDTAIVDFREALHIEKIRNAFFAQLCGEFDLA